MSDSPHKTAGTGARSALIWLALGLFVVFFFNVAMQRFWTGWFELPVALEAVLLVVATGCFISGCLKLESRQSSTP